MDPNRKNTKKFDSKFINRQYFHRKTRLKHMPFDKKFQEKQKFKF